MLATAAADLLLFGPNAHRNKQKFVTARLFRLHRCWIHSRRRFACAKVSDWFASADRLHWFPEALGSYAGTIRTQPITASTPAFLVCAGGWLVLVGVPVVAYALSCGI